MKQGFFSMLLNVGIRLNVVLLIGAPLLLADPSSSSNIDFSREILPILSDACFQCHGPDSKSRKADLRLDVEESTKRLSDAGIPIIDPGNADHSDLIQRLITKDPDDLMPPPELDRPLDEEKIEKIRDWVNQGAPWGKHWSLNPIERPTPPASGMHPIDAFVDRTLETEGLKAQPAADRRTLIRRLALDLTGLPPTEREVEDILNDGTPFWWENAIDRYLASPAYGERMAWNWLDAARYADSNGYQGDRERTMWPWRDWVVQAFNKNLPWDDFTVWQLAGDLLPDATHEQQLATGFCRNHMINGEGGRIPEENRVDYVMDMTETMGTVWLGATLSCARCHDHKFDAYTRKEYYQFFDFFNQTPVTGGGGDPQTRPVLAVPSVTQTKNIAEAKSDLQLKSDDFDVVMRKYASDRSTWESSRLHELEKALSKNDSTQEEKLKEFLFLKEALGKPEDERSDEQKKQIKEDWIASIPELSHARQQRDQAGDRLSKLESAVPKVMIMEDMEKRRVTPTLERGLYNVTGDPVSAAVPASLPSLDVQGAIPNRLDLARWLIRRDHPLTARVTVNRFWQQLFGIGLVKTAEDFGVQGEFPRHIELLDWLSAEFIESGWNVKHLMKTILTSATYQRSSVTTPELNEVDPDNRLFARAARFRLPSWILRDQALAAAGLLDPTIGGASVNGYQPDGVWEDATFGNKKYRRDTGRRLYRRSLYTFWRRIVAPTLFFDTASRQTCMVNATLTNSPLHALTTMNDTGFVEAARGLAVRAMTSSDAGGDMLDRIYRYLLPRSPSEEERGIWSNSFNRARQFFEANPDETKAWLSHGENKVPSHLEISDVAAWATVCLGILNLDETLNRE
jgi:hypothetical protein